MSIKRLSVFSNMAVILSLACAGSPAPDPCGDSARDRASAYMAELTSKAAYPLMAGVIVDADSTLFMGLSGDPALPEYQAYGKNGPAAPSFYVFSTNKTLTALAILQLAEEGKLSIDDKLSRWLDFLPWDASLRQVMSHSAGIPNPVIGNGYIHFEEERESYDPDALIRKTVAANPRLLFTPGSSVRYSNLGYALLGMVVSHASGEGYGERIGRKIFAPLGIDPRTASYDPGEIRNLAGSYIGANPFTQPLIKAGIPGERFSKAGRWKALRARYWFDFPSHGGLIISPEAMGVFLRAALRHDGRLLGQAGWEEYFSPQASSKDGKTVFALSWKICESRGVKRFEHTGGAFGDSAVISIYPEKGLASAWMGNRLDSSSVAWKDRPRLDALFLDEIR